MLVTAAGFLLALGIAIGSELQNSGSSPPRTGTSMDRNGNGTTIAARIGHMDPELARELTRAFNSIELADSEVIGFVGLESQSNTQTLFPVIRSPELEKQLMDMPPPEVPRQIANRLARNGWQVKPQRHFLSLNTPDGRSRIVPVGMLNYHFVGRQTF